MEELPDGPRWSLEELSSKWEILAGPSDALWALHFWSLDKGLAAPSWWSWSGPQAAPVLRADGKPWSSPTHLQSYLEPEEMALQWLTSVAARQTTVLAVKRVGVVTWDMGSWAGVTVQMTFLPWAPCPLPGHFCLTPGPAVSPAVSDIIQGGSLGLERNTFQEEMRVDGLKTSLYENISLSFKISPLHNQFAARLTMWTF